jgi:hypothetical protein
MRDRSDIESDFAASFNRATWRREVIQLEVLLDIRDALQEKAE